MVRVDNRAVSNLCACGGGAVRHLRSELEKKLKSMVFRIYSAISLCTSLKTLTALFRSSIFFNAPMLGVQKWIHEGNEWHVGWLRAYRRWSHICVIWSIFDVFLPPGMRYIIYYAYGKYIEKTSSLMSDVFSPYIYIIYIIYKLYMAASRKNPCGIVQL